MLLNAYFFNLHPRAETPRGDRQNGADRKRKGFRYSKTRSSGLGFENEQQADK